MTRSPWLGLCALLLVTTVADAQGKRDAIVIYKDGFVVKGQVQEQVREVIYDSASGQPFVIPSGNFHIDDHVRKIYFSPANVQKVFQFKAGEIKPPMKIVRFERVFQNLKIGESFRFDKIPWWDEKGERFVQVFNTATNRPIEMQQRIGIITSSYVTAATIDYEWNLVYFTSEFGPDHSRKIILSILDKEKKYATLKDGQKYLMIASFMQEAGWWKHAEEELETIIRNFAGERPTAEAALKKLRADRADALVKEIEEHAKIGQHQEAMDKLENYDRQELAKIASADARIKAADLKTRYEKLRADLAEASSLIKSIGGSLAGSPAWANATEVIRAELNYDTVDRLEMFLSFAPQYVADLKANRKPAQTAQELMALAVSGWLQGPKAAETDANAAQKLIHAREFLLDYLRNDNGAQRTNLASAFKKGNDLPVDVISRLLTMIPPPNSLDPKLVSREIQTIKIEAPNAGGGSYLLQLPPGYHPLRSYPVALVLHSGRAEKPEEMLARCSAEAARRGFILAAPLWGDGKLKPRYQYSAAEHAVAMDTLRDLRRRVQVDSDRVFLFGWEEGGIMAFDVGLGHPDQFAGVVPMNGALSPFTRRFYWPNAQYLPFYVIEGQNLVKNAKAMQELYKEWSRPPFTCFYVEYKGRGSEWFTGEIEKAFDWMSRKRRYLPTKELGRLNLSSTLDQEFRSSRESDTSFYWLRAETVLPRSLCDHRPTTRWATSYRPATFQGQITTGNKADAKIGAKIWTQASVRVSGVKQISFLITPGLINLENPLQLSVNGQQVGPLRTIQPSLETMLEELYESGDRQRLIIARIDVKL